MFLTENLRLRRFRASLPQYAAFPRMAILILLAAIPAASVFPQAARVQAPRTVANGPHTVPFSEATYARSVHVARSIGSDQSGDGSTAKPFASIARALAALRDAAPRKRYAIKVAEGLYEGDTIRLKEMIDLLGGFAAADWKRDIQRHASVLDGGKQRRVLDPANDSRVDGFTIRNGRVRGHGGAILCDGVSPLISNNVFIDNMALGPVSWKPKEYHEDAIDGGAIAVLRGAKPVIERNLFVRNGTEIGRGGAVAFNSKSSGVVRNNVFIENTSGWMDPMMRSSDGGALSIYDHSNPNIEGNTIVGNRAISENDGGGIFVALWSAPEISANVIVGNYGDDDAGGLFVGGQKHHYSSPLDPFPPEDQYLVKVTRNLLAGNANRSGDSGALRLTMECRVLFANNVVVDNLSGVYLQRSELQILNNTFGDAVLFVETKKGIKPAVFANNIIWGPFRSNAPAKVEFNIFKYKPGDAVHDNLNERPGFLEDGVRLIGEKASYRPDRFVTELTLSSPALRPDELMNRVVQIGQRWGVIRSNTGNQVTIWGDFSQDRILQVLSSYQLAAGSPCIDGGSNELGVKVDFLGRKRPVRGEKGLVTDLGAYEYHPK
jgi:Protein of unknown function (DUF1565)